MKVKMVLISTLSVMALLAAASVYAGQGGMGSGPGMGKGAAMWGDLSKEQQAQVATLRVEFMKKIHPLRTEMGQKRIELTELASKEKPDEQVIQKKREEMWALQDAMRNERRAMTTKFRALLTPEQREKIGPMGAGMGFGGGIGRCGFGGPGEGFREGGKGCKGWSRGNSDL